MHIKSLSYSGVKRLEDTSNHPISFLRADGTLRPWTVLLGENGTCKTTLLQLIALAAVGQRRSDQLAEQHIAALRDLKRPKANVVIEAIFGFEREHHKERLYPGLRHRPADPPLLLSRLSLAPKRALWAGESRFVYEEPGPGGVVEIPRQGSITDPLTEARSLGAQHWFVAGYGTNRFLPLPGAAPKVTTPDVDRLRSLFGDRSLTSIGFADDFKGDMARLFTRVLKTALTASPDLAPDLLDVELRGSGGVGTAEALAQRHRFKMKLGEQSAKLPAVWLSQGYQSTIGWIADLVGYVLKESGKVRITPEAFEGIVLIDELDLHLHPAWQKGIVRALRETFPRIQFIATTHSPMVLPGLEPDEVLILCEDERSGRVQVTQPEHPTKLRTGSELYRDFFGVRGLEPADLAKKARDYRTLAANTRRTDEEEMQRLALAAELEAEGISVAPPLERRRDEEAP